MQPTDNHSLRREALMSATAIHFLTENLWWFASGGLACFLAGIGAAIALRHMLSTVDAIHGNAPLLALALNNMTQGVVMFDAANRLVAFNKRYLEIYGLSPDVVKPGATLTDIIRHRFAKGNFGRDSVQYADELKNLMSSGKVLSFVSELADGRSIAVVNRAIPGGAYWLGTHHDITARRAAEKKSALLNEQEARRAIVEDAIAWFRQSVEAALQTVAEGVAVMKSTASALSACSNDTTAHTTAVVQTSNDASGRVDSASTAAEELSKSISEINHQLMRASDVVRAAAVEAQSTNAEIAGLAQATQKIDDVVKLIQSVAGQTNLLALNATIEAARAGNAGKGFAVVASEVKALAVQTAKATEIIAGQIAAVQSSTQSTVRAIASITSRMQEIQKFTAAIAAAVEQQHTATADISNNVAAAASGTKSVAGDLQRVSTAIGEMGNAAGTVASASAAVERAADSLRGNIEDFLRKVAV